MKETKEEAYSITFIEEEFWKIHHPYHDTLVIIFQIENHKI